MLSNFDGFLLFPFCHQSSLTPLFSTAAVRQRLASTYLALPIFTLTYTLISMFTVGNFRWLYYTKLAMPRRKKHGNLDGRNRQKRRTQLEQQRRQEKRQVLEWKEAEQLLNKQHQEERYSTSCTKVYTAVCIRLWTTTRDATLPVFPKIPFCSWIFQIFSPKLNIYLQKLTYIVLGHLTYFSFLKKWGSMTPVPTYALISGFLPGS